MTTPFSLDDVRVILIHRGHAPEQVDEMLDLVNLSLGAHPAAVCADTRPAARRTSSRSAADAIASAAERAAKSEKSLKRTKRWGAALVLGASALHGILMVMFVLMAARLL